MCGMVTLDPLVLASLRPRRDSTVARLAPRQQEVLELIAQGYNNTAIAQRLTLAEKSVETYINAIYQGLGLSGEPEIHARVKATLAYLEESQSCQ
jgi:DNA-binding NarL/FixJ family response regulator